MICPALVVSLPGWHANLLQPIRVRYRSPSRFESAESMSAVVSRISFLSLGTSQLASLDRVVLLSPWYLVSSIHLRNTLRQAITKDSGPQ
jgi:hypothetical protein